MELKYSDAEFKEKGKDNPEQSEKEKKGRLKKFCSKLWDNTKRTTQVLAVAVGMTVIAHGCSLSTMGTFKFDANDGEVEIDSETDNNEIDGIEDPIDVPDVEIIEEDAGPDGEDVVDVDIVDVDIESDGPEPTCFDIPTPLDKDVDELLKRTSPQDAAFGGPGSTGIDADVIMNVSITGYPDILLGECPGDPNAIAFIAAPGEEYVFERDVSVEVGSSWNATVPYMEGILCSPLSDDSATLISRNTEVQEVPKNATMGGTETHVGFTLQEVVAEMVAYDINGTIDSDGVMTVEGSDFSSANTAKTIVVDNDWNIEVDVRAGESSEVHTYTATITSAESKEARIYPKASEDDQMYGVDWDQSRRIWCARCLGQETLNLVITGDLICKIADECGCVGDGFDVNVLGVTLDKSSIPPHLEGYYGEADPPVRVAVGVEALSDPSVDHPSVSVTLEKNRTGGGFDDGVIANMTLSVTIEFVSRHENPDGTHDTRQVTLNIPLTDPWAWGSLEPTYTTECGCAPVY